MDFTAVAIETRESWQLVPSTVRVLSNVLPTWLARSVVSPHGAAAAVALSLCGLLSCVCTTWRDSVREVLGQVAAQLAPGLLGLGPRPWATMQQRPWAVQLRLVVRRVRLVQMWANVQGLRGLCTLVTGGSADAGPDTVTKVSYCTWTLSRETVLKWLTQLFEFAAVGSVASLGAKVNAGVDVEEVERARHAMVVSFASAVTDRLSLEPYEDAVRAYPPAAMTRFWHGYRAEAAGLRTHIANLASNAWQRVILDATLPLNDARGASALVGHFCIQHGELARLCQRSDPRVSMSLEGAARDRTRASIRKVLRRVCTIQRNEDQPRHEQTEMLDDSVLLDIVGKDWLRGRLDWLLQSEPQEELETEEKLLVVLDALRPQFRAPSVFACVKLWELSTRTQSFVGASSVALAASVAREAGAVRDAGTGTQTDAHTDDVVGLRLHGLPLLGSWWPECTSRKIPLAVLTPARDISHLRSPPATTVRSRSGLVDMRKVLSGPEHCRSSVVRTLTRDVQRVWRQAADLHHAGLPLVVAEPATVGSPDSGGVDLSVWRGMMQGPSGTPWEAGRFEFEMRIPLEFYPHKPPVLRFLGGCVFHPNVDEHGFVCADVLATEWSSVCSVATLLLSVQSILDDPSCEHPANVNAAALLVQDRAKYIEKVRTLSRATAERDPKLSAISNFSGTL
eukprot:COSAG02_NODE_4150_length_5709_cov_97.686631_3_plen_679_part_00